MSLKVVLEFSGRDEDGVDHILNLQVPHLGIGQYSTDKIDRMLYQLCMAFLLAVDHQDCVDHVCSCWYVQ